MKRSEINAILRENVELCRKYSFNLPPWAFWSPEQWAMAGHEWDEIRDCKLGWDITDYGSGKFDEMGLLLFTIRNGHPNLKQYTKPYCEKLLIVKEDQYTPCHFHWNKMEDIICRAGGNLLVKVYNATEDEQLADTPVPVNVDGHAYEVPAGSVIRLTPGESITLPAYNYHTFWAEAGTGTALLGEVSKVNDDEHDNRFLENQPRFSPIEEDEPALYLLCNEYPAAS
ncbi:MAG: D-lyxose/D-mannose family sugar isomerase [Armatimonadetes bacterium]|nr:D-lyxose/D-mannose family sugar isomerase [Armatimonadota bacterium]MDI9586908.1 D-lyxose/D-mannose family sugar isomerase [Acidobacteriota bacterium]